jgi:hypothetical protein
MSREYVYGRRKVQLLQSIVYDGDPVLGPYPIDAGVWSDGCSTDWWAWWFCPPLGRETEAAFLHDDMLTNQELTIWLLSIGIKSPRKWKDQKFREALRFCGTPTWKRWYMWLGVRINAWKTGDV